ncbi:hypothetical protein M569_05530, partial [Genlisea aurea]
SRRFTSRMRSASMSILSNQSEPMEQKNAVNFTGPLIAQGRTSGPQYTNLNHEVIFEPPTMALGQEMEILDGMNNGDLPPENYEVRNEHLLKSGPLGMCNDPYCTLCPSNYHVNAPSSRSRTAKRFDAKFQSLLRRDATGCKNRIWSFIQPYIPGVMNPHAKVIQRWNQLLVVSCIFAVFIDPLFFFLLLTQQEHNCIFLNWPLTKTLVVLRSFNDFIYFLHILLQFRLAYVAPESRVVGAGELVDDPKKIARNYLSKFFIIDVFVFLPLPQIIILVILPDSMGATGANYAKNLLRAAILLQYIPRLYRFFPLLAGQSSAGLIFESAWANFIMNLLMFVLASHVVGSCWYLFALQRVNQCLRDACHNSTISRCMKFLDCGHGNDLSAFENDPTWSQWLNNTDAIACFGQGGSFSYGIYQNGVLLTTESSVVTRYVYSLFWGFQQISTLAGNQVPSYFVWEVLFTMAIMGIGLLLFALLIGNMQNFLQSLGRRRLEMSLRRRDVEQWMRHRRLPHELQSQLRDAERFYWAATRGVNEEMLMENLPEDLQKDIRRHLFKFVKKVRLFQLLDEPIIDAICERLRTKTYIKGGKILVRGGLIDKMVFIIRGKVESIGEDQISVPLSENDVCGEELITWCLEHSAVKSDGKRIRIPGHRLVSNRLVRCITNVEAFVLRAADLEEVTGLFARFLRSPRVQGALRYESPYWRGLAARRIQVAWRYRKKRL